MKISVLFVEIIIQEVTLIKNANHITAFFFFFFFFLRLTEVDIPLKKETKTEKDKSL